jgi:hypoxanthine phosphoribosyltransferase
MHDHIERILYSEAEILSGIDRVAREVTQQYNDRDFTVVSVLKGSCVFASDLIRRIPIPLELAFLAASSYGDGTTSGRLEINFFPTGNEIEGRNLLLVDDILDTGRTLFRLRQELLRRGAREVETCVFLDKPARREVPIEPDFRCFEVENLFVVGYGLDFAGRYRNLPYVGALREAIYARPPVRAERT